MVSWDTVQVMLEEIFAQRNLEKVEITTKMNVIEDLDFDSLDMMELFQRIEDEFGVDFTDLEDFASRFEVCQDIWEGINELIEQRERYDNM